jgi:hypothetical protein
MEVVIDLLEEEVSRSRQATGEDDQLRVHDAAQIHAAHA